MPARKQAAPATPDAPTLDTTPPDAPDAPDAPTQDATQDAPPQDAAPAPLDIGAQARDEEISKAARVYVRAFPTAFDRPLLADGRLVDVVREVRADGSTGELLLSLIRVSKDKTTGKNIESAQRSSVTDAVLLREALAEVGVIY